MYIGQIQTIITLSQQFIQGDALLGDLANALDEPPGKLNTLLSMNGIIELNGTISPATTPQDIINVLCLYYSMAAYHDFVEMVWVGRTAQSRHGARRV